MKYYILLSCILISLVFIGCDRQGDQTDEEMFVVVNEVYQDFLFEFAIDGDLFSSPIIKNLQDGARSYTWMIHKEKNVQIGVQVVVEKTKGTKPRLKLLGDTMAMFQFVGSKRKAQQK